MERKRKISRQWISIGIIFAVCIVFNCISWFSADFSDWYRDNVFLLFQPFWSRITGTFPFSVGEIMICVAVFGGVGAIISYIVLMIKGKGRRLRISSVYGRILGWVLSFVMIALTFNFFMLYHCSTFASIHGISENQYTSRQLYELTKIMVEKCNKASENVSRDENGRFILTSDLNSEAVKAMQGISDKYVTLSGYYPQPKTIHFSKLMTQFNLLGIYFPYSMEANYNPLMYEAEMPATVCHEYAHLKGWIQEDEANFISYLTCINSDEPEFIYSGYLLAVDYMYSKVYNDAAITSEEVAGLISMMDSSVIFDLNEQHVVFREMQKSKVGKAAAKVSDTAMEASLVFNGVEDGKKSYGRFVDLLLNYYLGEEQ